MPHDDGRRVVLHVGLHKTGTTYLQGVLRANHAVLADQGVWVPVPDATGVPSATMAAWDLRGRRSERSHDRRQVGQWDALCATAARSPLPVALLSAESLSLLARRQASRAVAGFADRSPTVVVTCRDLGRVLVSAWQESVKNGAVEDWSTYVAMVRDRDARGRDPARGFWLNHDLAAVLAVWSRVVPADRLVVVTLPPAGAPPGTLLARFAAAAGFDPTPLYAYSAHTNPGLGVAGSEVVRRLNRRLDGRLNGRQHDHVVRYVVAGGLREVGDERIGLPAEELPWLTGEARRTVAAVRRSGARVVGDLDDLLPRPDPGARLPGSATEEEVAAAALVGLERLTERYGRLWWRSRRGDPARSEPEGLRTRVGSARRRLDFTCRRLVADAADRNHLAARAVGAYLRAGRR